MPGPAFLSRLPKPALFALYGALGGLLGAVALGEPLWYALKPPAPPPAPAPEPPAPRLAVAAAPSVQLYPGGANTVGVQVAREHFAGPVTVSFGPLPPGLRVKDVVIPEGKTSGTAQVAADPGLAPGPRPVPVAASARVGDRPVAAEKGLAVTVHVLAPPPEPPRLAVAVSSDIQVYKGGKNTFAVQVARAGFDGPVEVSFDGLPAGLTAPPVTVAAGQVEASAELTAAPDLAPGRHGVAVAARATASGAQPLTAAGQTAVEVLSPPKVPVDIVFALDISGSMQWAINGTSRGIQTFVDGLAREQFDVRVGLVGFRDTTRKQPLEFLEVGGEKLTKDFARFRAEVGKLRAGGGGAEGESGLDGVAAAAEFPFRTQVTRVVILITDEGPKRPDGRMKSVEDTAAFVKDKRVDQLHVVTLPELQKEFAPLWDGAKGKYFNLRALNAGAEGFEKLLPDVGKAIVDLVAERPSGKPELAPPPALPKLPDARASAPALAPAAPPAPPALPPLEVKSLQSSERYAAGTEWRQAARSGLWTGAIAALVCVALLAGQHRYLRGGWPPPRAALVGFGGGLLVGLIGGAAGQGLFALAGTDNRFVVALFRVLAWALLGGLAGAGLSLFIPNLGAAPGLLGGAVGGAAGAVGYLGVSALTGDLTGRLAGGVALGSALGLMVSLAESAFRRAWLEVRFGDRESIAVSLGAEPVKVGGDARACAVWARGAPAEALRFFVRDGRVICTDLLNRTEEAVAGGFSRAVGGVTVVVRTGEAASAPRRAAPPPLAASKPKPDLPPLLDLGDPDDGLPSSPPSNDPQPRRAGAGTDAPSPPPYDPQPRRAGAGTDGGAAPPAPLAPGRAPNIARKSADGCPGCGRTVPGAPGGRYCMVCDQTF